MEQIINNLQDILQTVLTISLPVSTVLLLLLAWRVYGPSFAGGRGSSGGRSSRSSGAGTRRFEGLGGGIGSASKGIGQGLGGAAKGVGQGLGDAGKGVGMGLGSTLKGLGEGLGTLTKGIGKGLGDLATGLTKPAALIGRGLGNVVKSVRNETVRDLQWAWNSYNGRRTNKKTRLPEGQASSSECQQALPPNIFNAGDIDSAEEILALCKAVNIEAEIDGTHVAINPHKLKHAENVLAMAGYNVKFPSVDDDEVVLDLNPETGKWEPTTIDDNTVDSPTWGERINTWNGKLEDIFLKLQLAWDPRPDGKFADPPDDQTYVEAASNGETTQKGES